VHLILNAGGTDYNRGLENFSVDKANLIITGMPLWSHWAAMRV